MGPPESPRNLGTKGGFEGGPHYAERRHSLHFSSLGQTLGMFRIQTERNIIVLQIFPLFLNQLKLKFVQKQEERIFFIIHIRFDKKWN